MPLGEAPPNYCLLLDILYTDKSHPSNSNPLITTKNGVPKWTNVKIRLAIRNNPKNDIDATLTFVEARTLSALNPRAVDNVAANPIKLPTASNTALLLAFDRLYNP